jgi:hypothetical protein
MRVGHGTILFYPPKDERRKKVSVSSTKKPKPKAFFEGQFTSDATNGPGVFVIRSAVPASTAPSPSNEVGEIRRAAPSDFALFSRFRFGGNDVIWITLNEKQLGLFLPEDVVGSVRLSDGCWK